MLIIVKVMVKQTKYKNINVLFLQNCYEAVLIATTSHIRGEMIYIFQQ